VFSTILGVLHRGVDAGISGPSVLTQYIFCGLYRKVMAFASPEIPSNCNAATQEARGKEKKRTESTQYPAHCIPTILNGSRIKQTT